MHRAMVLRASLLLITVAALAAFAGTPVAQAATTFRVSLTGATSGPCGDVTTPCGLEYAWTQLNAGDELVVEPGTYTVATPLSASVPVTVRGVAGQTHPRIDSTHTDPTIELTAGGTIEHLAAGASGAGQVAVAMGAGGTIEDFAAQSADGPALTVGSTTTQTIVRDAVFVSKSINPAIAAVALDGTADVSLLNLTVWAATGPDGIACSVTTGNATLTNVLVRGTSRDIDATSMGDRCTARASNFRSNRAPGVPVNASNQSAAPRLGDTTAGDFRPRTGSPTIDAGMDDALLGATDPDGVQRWLGQKPDIGAYEAAGPQPPAGPPTEPATDRTVPTLPETAALPAQPALQVPPTTPPAPVLGKTVTLGAIEGEVKVRAPGGRFVNLDDAKNIPVGTVIDTRKGQITLTSALPGGKKQTGTFSGGMFEVRQSRRAKGMTDIILRGALPTCRRGKATSKRVARAAAKSKSKRRSTRRKARRLWAKDKGGRFRTHGRRSVATVRGTKWLTEDRCSGTYTRVVQGAVDVRSKRTGKVKRIRRGRSILVRR